MLRYTEEEFKKIKQLEKDTLLYGKAHIIGRYEFRHEAFGDKAAQFVRNSFSENLRYGEGMKDKATILCNIANLLPAALYIKFAQNIKPEQKPNVEGYYIFSGEYNGNNVVYYFEKRKDGYIVFYAIKLYKKSKPN